MPIENPLGDARARRLREIVQDLTARTTRPAEMPDPVFSAMVRRMATHQLVDEELRTAFAESEPRPVRKPPAIIEQFRQESDRP